MHAEQTMRLENLVDGVCVSPAVALVGTSGRQSRSPSISRVRPRRSTQSVLYASYVTAGPKAGRCFPSHSPTLRPWIGGRSCAAASPSSYVEGLWSPALVTRCKNGRLKPQIIHPHLLLRAAQRAFLSQAGPHVCSVPSQAEHHLLFRVGLCQNDEGGPLGPPSLRAAMRRWFLAIAPLCEGHDEAR